MSKRFATLFFATGLLFTADAAYAHQGDWRWTPATASTRHITQSDLQIRTSISSSHICEMGSYIRWTCRGDQICGSAAGACR
jgi:hypothetical protein